MASGWTLWVWLPCIGVVSGCCCKEVYRYPHVTVVLCTLNIIVCYVILCNVLEYS